MKMLFVLILTISVTANGQVNDQFKNRLWQEYKNKKLDTDRYRLRPKNDSVLRLLPKIERPQVPVFPDDMAVVKMPMKGKYLGGNGMGSEIFSMTPDNMPCLVPNKNFKSGMPVVGVEKYKSLKIPLDNNAEDLQQQLDMLKPESPR